MSASGSASGGELVLDPAIRDWVVLPMVLMLVLVGLGRHYVQQLIKGDEKVDPEAVANKQLVLRAKVLRANRGLVSEEAFSARRSLLCRKGSGLLRKQVAAPPNPMMGGDMSGMMNMMKGNMTFMLPNMVMMAFVSYFFAGFILVKVPFPLPSNGFKLMLQRGVDLATLDVSYVSSLSWYFLVTFGLSGIHRLILGDEAAGMEDVMQMQMGGMGMMGMGGGGGGQPFDAAAAFKGERQMLMLTKHTSSGERAEAALLGDRYPHPLSSAATALPSTGSGSGSDGTSARPSGAASAAHVNLAKFGAAGGAQQTKKSFGSSAAAAAALAGKKNK